MQHADERIFITGHTDLLGSAIVRRLLRRGHAARHIVTRPIHQLNLNNQSAVRRFFDQERPDKVYLHMAAPYRPPPQASRTADILQQRLSTLTHVIEAAFNAGVKKLLLLAGHDAYPVTALQPMVEEDLLGGPLMPSRAARATADLVGIQLCESYNQQYGQSLGIDYRCALTCETYGPGDAWADESTGAVASLIALLHNATRCQLPWVPVEGHALARHEILYVDDLADASIYAMEVAQTALRQHPTHSACINLGSGTDLTLRWLAQAVANTVGYPGTLLFSQDSEADAPPRRLLDVHRLNVLGWSPQTELGTGLSLCYQDYKRRQTSTMGPPAPNPAH